ncbi:MAG: putative tRNA (cytidine(34)-2'-O)-methyltransferase [Phycisphaerales bacterium]|nr:MAG: putative tRNA (cytidine(34)-2'-O)-methyltransferase [Phycisphaerales bacterium]
MDQPRFHVVLYQPVIPNNTGNIGRTCLAFGAALHLVCPLGFSLEEKALRRAGLDYWPRLAPFVHEDWDAYLRAWPTARRWYFEARRGRPHFQAAYRPGDHLVFGPETSGLPEALLQGRQADTVAIPLVQGERSLNLATAVAVGLAEGVRQLVEGRLLALSPGPSLPGAGVEGLGASGHGSAG